MSHDTPRTFLVMADETEEMRAALRFACGRAGATGGRVALLRVIAPPSFQHFMGIGERMDKEAHGVAEERLQSLAAEVNAMCGQMATLFIRKGDPIEELTALIAEHPEISILVLGAGSGAGGPGPLVSSLSDRLSKLPVPVTIVPGALSDGEIDALT